MTRPLAIRLLSGICVLGFVGVLVALFSTATVTVSGEASVPGEGTTETYAWALTCAAPVDTGPDAVGKQVPDADDPVELGWDAVDHHGVAEVARTSVCTRTRSHRTLLAGVAGLVGLAALLGVVAVSLGARVAALEAAREQEQVARRIAEARAQIHRDV